MAKEEKPHYNADGELLCPRCGRVVTGWPIRRADVCSPKQWVHCIRSREDVQRDWRNRSRGLTESQVVEPVKHFHHYSSDQRADRQASFRLTPGQRDSVGEVFWTHPSLPGVGFPTRAAALRAVARLAESAPDFRQKNLMEVIQMPTADALKILGLPPAFSPDELKTAYRTKSLANHPDRGGSTSAMAQINLAHEVLSGKGNGNSGAVDWNTVRRENEAKGAAFEKIVKDAFHGHFKVETFTRHFTSVFGMPFTVNVKERESPFSSWSWFYEAEFANADKTIVVSLHITMDYSELFRGNLLSNPDSGVSMTFWTEILVGTKKVKLGQQNYKLDRSYATLSDPAVLFPREKLLAQVEKSASRKLSKRDVLLRFSKTLGARINESGGSVWAYVPVGQFTVALYRMTFMGTALWDINGIYEKNRKVDATNQAANFVEGPDGIGFVMDALKSLQKNPPMTAGEVASRLNTVVASYRARPK